MSDLGEGDAGKVSVILHSVNTRVLYRRVGIWSMELDPPGSIRVTYRWMLPATCLVVGGLSANLLRLLHYTTVQEIKFLIPHHHTLLLHYSTISR